MRKTRLLTLLVLLLTAATGAWADESSESFTTTSGAASYTGEHFKISLDDEGDGDGFFLSESDYARIEALNGEIITKVEFTAGYYDITRLRSAVGTTTYEGEVATVSGVNATSLAVNAPDQVQIKAVKVYYSTPTTESFTTNSEASSYTGEHFKISLVDGGDEDGFYLGESDYASIEALNGEIITKVEFTQGGWSITDLRSAVGTTTYEGEVATVSGVNATSLTVNAANTLQIKAVKVYYTAPTTVATGYSVSLKDGVKDADKWTVKVGEGQAQALPIGGLKGDGSETVTLQYTGRLKVKGVKATSDAAPAKTPATVTTAPTGAAIVGVGKTTALVSGGAADGGTLMYAVTTTNTKPTSTAGFSDAVPTAETIKASGKVYVWYYVKADDTHSDSEIAATAIEVPVADIVWDVTNVTDIVADGYGGSYEKEGVTLSGNNGDVYAWWIDNGDPTTDGISFSGSEPVGYTFWAPAGKAFTKIEMIAVGYDGWEDANLGTGWTFNNPTVTWKGSAAASTVGLLTGDIFDGAPVKSIAFYLSE